MPGSCNGALLSRSQLLMGASKQHVKPNCHANQMTIAGAMLSSLPEQRRALVSTVVPHLKREFLRPWELFLQGHGIESSYQQVEAAEHSVHTSALDIDGADAVPGNNAIKTLCGHTVVQSGADHQASPGLGKEVLGPCAITAQADSDVTDQCPGSMLGSLNTEVSTQKDKKRAQDRELLGPQSCRGGGQGTAALYDGNDSVILCQNTLVPEDYKTSCEVRKEIELGVPAWMFQCVLRCIVACSMLCSMIPQVSVQVTNKRFRIVIHCATSRHMRCWYVERPPKMQRPRDAQVPDGDKANRPKAALPATSACEPVSDAGAVRNTVEAAHGGMGAELRPQVTSESRRALVRMGQGSWPMRTQAFPVAGIELQHVAMSEEHQELLALMRAVETSLSCCMS